MCNFWILRFFHQSFDKPDEAIVTIAVKYEHVSKNIFKDPGKMKKPLFRLLYTVKMIFDVSTFYNRFIFKHDFSVDKVIV